jgi:hypothetical protein
MTTTSATAAPASFSRALRRLYFIRAAFTVVWAVLLVVAAMNAGPLLTVLLVIYPLFDAGAVLWQLRAHPAKDRSSASEWVNIIVSLLVAIALGVSSTFSTSAALIVWGIWAIGAGIPQLVSAIRNRRTGGQVPQMLSGGISVFAGASFVIQGLQGAQAIAGVAGYATLGAIFFLVSAIRLSSIIRKEAR